MELFMKAENKTLASFAKKALDNYLLSQNDSETSKRILETKSVFESFVDHIQNEIDKSIDHKYHITDKVYLFDLDGSRFKYKGDNWIAHEKGLNMKFSELKKIIQADVKGRADIKKVDGLEELSKQHATYFFNAVEKFREFEKGYQSKVDDKKVKEVTVLKNYVLIIDEINRANLSSVLGELIYALEYRYDLEHPDDTTVESMYSVDGNSKLSLPPNLYIIGTMNTADRSVGHIDYAIRRRFAFVDVLPQDLSNEEGVNFHKTLFNEVARYFDHSTHLSNEFEPKDVQLGHSYFIDKLSEGGSMAIRLQYEIKPILLEYVKDGILIGNDIKQKIEALTV